MTYEDYVEFVRVYIRRHPEQRPGQAAMNVLRSLVGHDHLFNAAIAEGIDPWDRTEQMGAFFTFVRERWDEL